MIQREISDPLALALLKGEYRDGDTVVVDASPDGSLTFSSGPGSNIRHLTVTCGGRLTDVREGSTTLLST